MLQGEIFTQIYLWPLLTALLFMALLNGFPLYFFQSQQTLTQVIALGISLIYGPINAMWVIVLGVPIGIFYRRITQRRKVIHPGSGNNLLGQLFYEIGLLVIPLMLVTRLFNWQSGLANPAPQLNISSENILLISIAFLSFHALLLLGSYALGERAGTDTFRKDLSTLIWIELLPLPFVIISTLIYPQIESAALAILAGVPAIISVLLNNSTLVQGDLQRRIQDLSMLNQVSHVLRYSLNMDDLLETIQEEVFNLMGIENFYVALYEPEDETLWYPIAVKHGKKRRWEKRMLTDRLTDRVIREGKPILLARDAFDEMKRIGVPLEGDVVHAWLGVPLITPERVLGCLAVLSHSPDIEFNQANLELLTTLSGQVSVTLLNALLYEQINSRAEQLEALNQSSTTLSASLNPEDVFNAISASLSKVSAGRRSALYLLDAEQGVFELTHSHGLTGIYTDKVQSFPIEGDTRLETLLQGQPVLKHHMADFTPPPYHEKLLLESIKAYADFPLISADGQIGYLSIFFDQPQTFPPEEVKLLQTFSAQAALAIANASRYASADLAQARRAEQLNMLQLVGKHISAALSPDELFEMILDYACEFTDSPWGSIALANPNSPNFVIKAHRGYDSIPDTITIDTGIAGRVLKTQKAEIDNAVSDNPDFLDLTDGQTSAQLTVPMIHKDHTLGLIVLETTHPAGYNENQLHFISQLADQTALAVLNTDLYEEAQNRLHEQAALHLIANRLGSSQQIQAVLNAVVQAFSATMNSFLTGVFLWDKNDRKYTCRTKMERNHEYDVSLPDSITVQTVLALRQIHPSLAHITINRVLPESISSELQISENYHFVAVPLLVADDILGMVIAYLPTDQKVTAEDFHLPEAIAAQSGIALQNAQLFSDMTKGRDLLEAVIDSVGESVIMIDAQGYLTLANAPVEMLASIFVDEIQNKCLTDLPTDILAALGFNLQSARDLLETPLGQTIHLKPPRHRYEYKDLYLERSTAPVLNAAHQMLGWVLVLRDITEEHEIDQARMLLTETLVHDLRSPIGTIKATLELMIENLQEEDPRSITLQSLDIANRSTQRVLSLIESLLEISQLESGTLELQLQETNISSLIEDSISELVHQASEASQILHYQLPANLPILNLDRSLIHRVLVNLLDNALKFTDEGGQIFISSEAKHNRLEVKVTDTGPGIPAEYYQMVFERFRQVPGVLGRRRGSGLGLTFCQLAIEAHGGRIWIEPGPENQGTTFCFSLPYHRSQRHYTSVTDGD